MTRQEADFISPNTLHEFLMYYGETKIGIIHKHGDKYYFISQKYIPQISSDINSFIQNAEEIDIDTIVEHKHYYKTSYDNTRVSNSYNVFGVNDSFGNKVVTPLNATKMIVLGAGASFDFSFDDRLDDTKRPPLTFNLFDDEYDDILSQYPGANLLASRILQSGNVESFFQEQWEILKMHFDLDLLNKIINTQYYLQHLFKDISSKCANNKRSNYSSLISQLSGFIARSREQVIITSFNYDTLIEQSINSVYGYSYEQIEDYIRPDRKINLFKPHGSWNWIREFKYGFSNISNQATNNPHSLFATYLYKEKKSYADIFKALDEKVLIKNDLNLHVTIGHGQRNFMPQLLIPFTDKDDFVMPSHHRQTFKNKLKNIQEIIIIGWKGTEYVFLDLLRQEIGEKKVHITVANKDDGQSVKNVFKDVLPNAEWRIKTTFSELMKESQKDKTLFYS